MCKMPYSHIHSVGERGSEANKKACDLCVSITGWVFYMAVSDSIPGMIWHAVGAQGVTFPGLLSLVMSSELCVVTAGYCPSPHLAAR